MEIILIHAVIVFMGLIVVYFFHMRNMRMKASFNLYRVRDRFVLLAAQGILHEDSRVYKYYYIKINELLRDAPKVGLDDMLEVMFRHVRPGAFDLALQKSRKAAEALQKDPLVLNNGEVREAIADYYSAIISMILAHSSVVRLLFVLSKRFACSVSSKLLNEESRRGLKVIDFADQEAKLFLSGRNSSCRLAHA